jgi:hypothetical protein
MKRFLSLAILTLCIPVAAHGATLNFPSEGPFASITIPDSWQPEETETGVQGTSSDSAVYLSVDVADTNSIEKVTSDAIDFLSQNGVTIDPKTQKETPVEEVNGLQMTTLDWDGKDSDGPVSVGLAFLATSGEKALVVTYWGTKGKEDKQDADLGKILASIKMAN